MKTADHKVLVFKGIMTLIIIAGNSLGVLAQDTLSIEAAIDRTLKNNLSIRQIFI